MTDTAPPTGSLAGYRLVRKLGDGARSEVYLGTPGSAPAESSVAVKVFRPQADANSIAAELAVLSRELPAHCAKLLDVAQAADGRPLFVLSRVDRGSIGRLVHMRGSITAGEAVTLVAPLALVLSELHARGIAHGAIGPRTVHLTQQGEPVLIGFGHATLFPAMASAATRAGIAAVSADRIGLARIASMILSTVAGPPEGRRPLELVDWIELASASEEFPSELAGRLFEMADPAPIDFSTRRLEPAGGDNERSRQSAAGPLHIPVAVVPAVDHSSSTPVPGRRSGRWNAHADVFLGGNPVEQFRQRLARTLSVVPRRVWLVLAVLAFAALTFLFLAQDTTEVPAGRPLDGDTNIASDSASDGVGNAAAPETDDPIEAVAAILEARSRCLELLSVLCLESVDHPGSSAMQGDRDLIAALIGGTADAPTIQYLPGDFRLVERLGDAALVELGPQSQPASVLIIRTEAGWRLRELLGT